MRIHAVSVSPLPADLRARLAALGETRCFDAALDDPGFADKLRGAEILILSPRLPFDITPRLDACRFISMQATGVDALNIEACRARGIVVSNVPDFCADAVAEHAFALLLSAAKRLDAGRELLLRGEWDRPLAFFTTGLRGRRLGVFGLGRIGSRVAAIGAGFGMRVAAVARDPAKRRTVPTTDLDGLLAESDFIVLAAPATRDTRRLFDRRAFERIKPGAVLVNVARAALVDSDALLAALDSGRLGAYATDVFEPEPPAPDDPLPRHPRVTISPHVAWGATESVERVLRVSVENVEAYVRGEPIHVVS